MSESDFLSETPAFNRADFDRLLSRLAAAAPKLEEDGAAPVEQFQWLAEAGVLGWVIPREYGGSEVSQEHLIYGYERLAAACLTTCFVLTQRNGACQRIAGGEGDDVKAELLPRLSRGEIFATVGVSHLTTSRQHLARPAVGVRLGDESVDMHGAVPWVTGAELADYVVTGGTSDDGRQVLVAVSTRLDGVHVQQPARLLSLTASRTASIELEQVVVPRSQLIAGPVERVMQRGRGGGAGSVATSSLAVGVTVRVLEELAEEAQRRPDIEESLRAMQQELGSLRRDLYAAARGESADENPNLDPGAIRKRSNSLVLRATQAYLAASKGAGFVQGHPAERAVREAMFFLVWSCPQPVLDAAMRQFACLGE